MKNIIVIGLCFMLAISLSALSIAAEHGGKEHGGTSPLMKEEKAKMPKEPSKSDIQTVMKSYIDGVVKAKGAFSVNDPETGKVRRLELSRIHDRVGKTGNYYYSCADFKDLDSGEMLDLDLDVKSSDGKLQVVDTRIHKVSGKERYTYDENDNRIPVKN